MASVVFLGHNVLTSSKTLPLVLTKTEVCISIIIESPYHVFGHRNSILPVPGKFPAHRPVTRSFDVFIGPRLIPRT